MFPLLAIGLLACLPKAPPIYWAEIPQMKDIPVLDLGPVDGECAMVDLIVGETIYPAVAVDGEVQCYGHVISTSDLLYQDHRSDLASLWEERANICTAYRTADRNTCEVAYQAQWQDATQSRRRGAALELAVGGAFIGGVVLGALAASAPALVTQ